MTNPSTVGPPSGGLTEVSPFQRVSAAQGQTDISANLVFEVAFVTLRRHYKWSIPMALLLAMSGAAFLWWSSEPTYKSSHWVEVSKHRVLSPGAASRPTNLVSTETPIILSEIILDPVLARPEIQSLPNFQDPSERERHLRDNLKLKPGGTSGRLTITFTDTDANSSSTVCNAVADEYMEYRREYEQRQADLILRSLRPELKKWEDLVKELEKNVENLTLSAISAGELSAISTREVTVSVTGGRFSFIAELRKRINDLMLEQVGLEAKIKRINADWPANRSEIETAVQNDPEVQDLRALIGSYRGVVRGIKVAGMESIKRKELAMLQQQILDATGDLEAAEDLAGKNLLNTWASNVTEGLERELYISRFELEMLQSVFEEEKSRFLKAGDQSLKLRFAEDDLASAQGLLDGLRQRSLSIEMESRYADPVISLRRATKPEHPVAPAYLTKSNAMVLLALGLVPFGLAAGLEFKLNRFTTVKAIADRVELPVLGEIAAINELVKFETAKETKKTKRYRSYTYASDIHRQSVDNLRIRLTLGDHLKLGHVTAVLSSFEGEGKTTLSKDLAHCISESNDQKTLLIDMDLRCPNQHRIWGLKNRDGVCEALRGDISFRKAVRSVGNSFDVMPAGKNKHMHLSSVVSNTIEELFQWARTQYDYVIVDTAPLNYASESLVIAKYSDTAVLSLLRDVSRLEPTQYTVKNLNSVGVPLLGCVLSGITPLQYQYRYGNYYHYRGTYYSKHSVDIIN